ncbi:MAG: tetratricopeptide repeat protein [Methylococcales bacterium]|nr:tetratricopeptide repeat protein [Methylococcales bacterium]
MVTKKLFIIVLPILSQIGCMGRSQPHPYIINTPPTSRPSYQPPPKTPAKTYQLKPIPKSVVRQQPPRPKKIIVQKKAPIAKTAIIRQKPKPLSSAVIALVNLSDKNARVGQLEPAVVNLERALRIEPRNALLTYKLAELKFKQVKFRLAENLALKSALLAAADTALKKKSWELIVKARRLQKNYMGAKEAQSKVQSFN